MFKCFVEELILLVVVVILYASMAVRGLIELFISACWLATMLIYKTTLTRKKKKKIYIYIYINKQLYWLDMSVYSN